MLEDQCESFLTQKYPPELRKPWPLSPIMRRKHETTYLHFQNLYLSINFYCIWIREESWLSTNENKLFGPLRLMQLIKNKQTFLHINWGNLKILTGNHNGSPPTSFYMLNFQHNTFSLILECTVLNYEVI